MTGTDANGQKSAEASLQPGQLVDGKYRVERLIGSGGMAAVWAGTNERTGKRVALKVVLRTLASNPAARDLFYSEGMVASRINHPNVVTIFDVIEHEGMPCMVMELLDGEPLSHLLERKRVLTVHEAACLILPAMRGVAAAHAEGVIHRDIKPQNVFLCVEPNGRIATTKVLDFGISVLIERVVDYSQGMFLGTPNYMSPEHVAGVAVIDGRADVYGFGLLFYEAMTGKMAFPGEPGSALYFDIMNKAPASVVALRPDIPLKLAKIIDRALAKQPDMRFASLNAMISALESVLLALGLGGPSPTAHSGRLAPIQDGSSEAASGELVQTKILYALSESSSVSTPRQTLAFAPGLETALPSQPRNPSPEVLRDDPDPDAQEDSPEVERVSRLGWKAGAAIIVGITLGILAWTSTRPRIPASLPSSVVKAELSQPASPSVSPVTAPEPAAIPAGDADVTPESVIADTTPILPIHPETTEAKKVRTHTRTAMVDSVVRTRVDADESVLEKRRAPVEQAESAPSELRTLSPPKIPTRAGSLSADDF